ncbi:MAG: AAA family ATPase [Rhodospirillales bacterium]
MSAGLALHMGEIAQRLLGEPNRALSTRTQLRFGTHGSLAVEIGGDEAGTWYDHENKTGGGVIDFVKRHINGCGSPIDWLKREGFIADAGTEKPRRKIAGAYDYRDELGNMLFQVVRFDPKDFRQRRPDGDGGWDWHVKGVRQVPYRIEDLLAQPDEPILVVEGEKDADRLASLGFIATCNAGGAGKWPSELNRHFAGRRVVIIPDKDDAGIKHAAAVEAALKGIAAEVCICPLPGANKKGFDTSDWLDAGGTAAELRKMCEEPKKQHRFTLVPFSQIRMQRRRLFVVSGILPSEGVAVIWGPPKYGKTFWIFDLAMHVALGWSYRGRRVAQGIVVYVACEGAIGLEARSEAWRREFLGDNAEDVPFYLVTTRLDLAKDATALIADIRSQLPQNTDVGLIVIDTLNRSLGGSENDDEDMAAYVAAADMIRESFTALVAIVHHCGVAGTRPRGHTSLTGAADAQIAVRRDDAGNVIAQVEYLKDGADGPDGAIITSRLRRVDLGTDEDGEAISSCVVTEADGAAAKTSGGKKLTADERGWLNDLTNMFATPGYAKEVVPMQGMPPVIGATRDATRNFFITVGRVGVALDVALTATERSKMSRYLNKLKDKGKIGIYGNWIWLTEASVA